MKNNRKVLFYDDFTDIVLDPTKWYIETTTVSDVNHEKRYTYMPSNLTVEDSNLVLTARRECYRGGNYTSASINTGNKFSFQYGRLEMRAKLPYGEGLWPALWLMGDSYFEHLDWDAWPRCGEIDVMQFIGIGGEEDRDRRDAYQSEYLSVYNNKIVGNNRTTCNLHWGVDRQHHKQSGTSYSLPEGVFADDYHIFAVEWTEEAIEWYVDDTLIHRVDINQPDMLDTFHKPHWIILSLNLVEDFDPTVKEITPFPQSFYIDYIRVLAPEKN